MAFPVPANCYEAVNGLDLSGEVYLVTGAYSGLGSATTKALLKAKASVIVAGRNRKLQDDFVTELKQEFGDDSKIDGTHFLDLADLASVQEFGKHIRQTYDTIDCLILNAGVMVTPFGTTKQGFEMQMGINAVGHFLLAKTLADRTKRQVWVSSRGHAMVSAPPPKFDKATAKPIKLEAIRIADNYDEKQYETWMRYQQSKLAKYLRAPWLGTDQPHASR